MDGVVAAAEPVGELQGCQEQVDGARSDVQVGQPRVCHVASIELVGRHSAVTQMRHVDGKAVDDGQDDDDDEQECGDLNRTKPLGAGGYRAGHGVTVRLSRQRIRSDLPGACATFEPPVARRAIVCS